MKQFCDYLCTCTFPVRLLEHQKWVLPEGPNPVEDGRACLKHIHTYILPLYPPPKLPDTLIGLQRGNISLKGPN